MIEFTPMSTHDEWLWFKERTHVIKQEDLKAICGWRNGRLVAVLALDTFTPVSCTAHICIEDPLVLRHGFLEKTAEHIFIESGLQRVFGLVPSNNVKALKLDRHIGFKEVARIPNTLGDGIDTVVMCMERHNCRFLPTEYRRAA